MDELSANDALRMFVLIFLHPIFIKSSHANKTHQVILADGLGILEIIYKFVEQHSNPKSLVFIINLSQNDIEFINMRLMSNISQNADSNSNHKLFYNVDSTISSHDRQNMYLTGGCISITSRILVADLLNNVIPYQSISGILVHKAHQFSRITMLIFPKNPFRSNAQVVKGEQFAILFGDLP